jgi:hypothetical protein
MERDAAKGRKARCFQAADAARAVAAASRQMQIVVAAAAFSD